MTMGEADALTSRAQGRLGTVLRGKYRLDRVLGVGGMAVVYKATHRNQAEFAVKMLHPELSIHEDIRTRFLREGYAANSVKHPGAVLVSDDDVAEDGAAFLVMELLQGAAVESLWEHSGHRVPVRAVLSVADQLLDVLAAAHAKGIVHRDIKPANLFALRDGTLKVLDFGIARVRDAAASGRSGQATGTGMLLGTPAFMAPEQAFAKSSEIDGQTDVWAVGATLFTLLSGQYVHQGENPSQLMVRAATEHARPVSSVVSDVPPMVAQVIDRALAFEKASRWPNATAMRDAIEKANLEAFDEKPSKAALAMLVTGDGLGGAKTEHAVLPPSREVTATMEPLPLVGRATPPTQPSGTRLPRLAGGTTAQPVSSDPLPSGVPGVPRGRRVRLIGAAVAGAIIMGGGGLLLLRGTPTGPGVSASTATASAPMTATASAPPLDPLLAASSASAVVVPPVAPPSATPANKSPLPAAHAGANPVLPIPSAKPTGASPSSPAPSSPPSAAPTPSKPKPNCDPPYTLDSNGEKHFKVECYSQ